LPIRSTNGALRHRALESPPVFWPCLPEPKRDTCAAARALYEQMDVRGG
jgi:hypothetical protein